MRDADRIDGRTALLALGPLTLVVALLLWPAAVDATSVKMTEPSEDPGDRFGGPGILIVSGDEGDDRIRLSLRNGGDFVVRDSSRVRPGAGCRALDVRAVLCPSTNPDPADGFTRVELRDGDDRFRVQRGFPTGITVAGGSGDDRLRGSSHPDDMRGDNGDDRIFGLRGADFISDSGHGVDRLYGGRGRDVVGPAFNHFPHNQRDYLFGGPGNDILSGGVKPVARQVDCGKGDKDRVRVLEDRRPRLKRCEDVRFFGVW
jgi:hypothetical protein